MKRNVDIPEVDHVQGTDPGIDTRDPDQDQDRTTEEEKDPEVNDLILDQFLKIAEETVEDQKVHQNQDLYPNPKTAKKEHLQKELMLRKTKPQLKNLTNII